MIRFNEFRKQRLLESIQNVSIKDGVNNYFDVLRLEMMDVSQIPLAITESYDGEVAEALNWIIDFDNSRHKSIVNEHILIWKEEFNHLLSEEGWNESIGVIPPDIAGDPDAASKLKKSVAWAINNLFDKFKTDFTTSLVGATPPGATPASASGPVATPSQPATPTQPGSQIPVPPSSTPLPPGSPGDVANTPPPGSSNGATPPWYQRKSKKWGPLNGLMNLGKTAARGTYNWLSNAWKGNDLADHVVYEVFSIMEKLYENADIGSMNMIDSLKQNVTQYINSYIDEYLGNTNSSGSSTPNTPDATGGIPRAGRPATPPASASPATPPASASPATPFVPAPIDFKSTKYGNFLKAIKNGTYINPKYFGVAKSHFLDPKKYNLKDYSALQLYNLLRALPGIDEPALAELPKDPAAQAPAAQAPAAQAPAAQAPAAQAPADNDPLTPDDLSALQAAKPKKANAPLPGGLTGRVVKTPTSSDSQSKAAGLPPQVTPEQIALNAKAKEVYDFYDSVLNTWKDFKLPGVEGLKIAENDPSLLEIAKDVQGMSDEEGGHAIFNKFLIPTYALLLNKPPEEVKAMVQKAYQSGGHVEQPQDVSQQTKGQPDSSVASQPDPLDDLDQMGHEIEQDDNKQEAINFAIQTLKDDRHIPESYKENISDPETIKQLEGWWDRGDTRSNAPWPNKEEFTKWVRNFLIATAKRKNMPAEVANLMTDEELQDILREAERAGLNMDDTQKVIETVAKAGVKKKYLIK